MRPELKHPDTWVVCSSCGQLAGVVNANANYIQRCRCGLGPEGPVDQPRGTWFGYDFNTAAELCRLCASALLRSGHRYSVWFCDACAKAVRGRNDALGKSVIPIGRHSIHAGKTVRASGSKAERETQAAELATLMRGLPERIEATEQWRARCVRAVVAEAGHSARPGLDEYLEAAGARVLDTGALLDGLVETLVDANEDPG